MRNEVIVHDKEHEERIRLLAEESLTGEEQRRAERDLLTCRRCLEEYNHYRRLWRIMTSAEYAERRAQYLKATNPERHQLYRRMLDQVMTKKPAPWVRWFGGMAFRNLAWGLSFSCVVIAAIAVYEAVTLKRDVSRKEAAYANLRAESARKDQTISQGKERIDQLNKQIALSKESVRAGETSERTGELRKKAEALLAQTQKQAGTIRELSQALEKYRRPGPGAFLLAQVFARRQTGEIQQIQLSKDTLFVVLQTRLSSVLDYERFHVVVKDARQQVLAEKHQAPNEDKRVLDYVLGSDMLKPGEYTLVIYGIAGNQETLISENPFRIIAGR